MQGSHTHRRPVVIGLAGAAALGVATAATKIAASVGGSGSPGHPPQLQLSADSGSSNVDSLTVRLGDTLLPQHSAHSWRSTELSTSTHSMVGFTWTGAHDPEVRIRSRVRGRWTAWQPVTVMHDVPDLDTREGRRAARGTHLVWIGDSDGIHIHVQGARPADLALVLLHPGRLPRDRSVAGTKASTTGVRGSARRATVATPTLLSRADWGANEKWRDKPPSYNTTLQQVHVHHTASGNDYSAGDVPALLRGFYRYHTHNLGWSDIGYNFLVDKYGRAWVGRAGGPGKLVRGAHTLGFNATSTGISVIGNYQVVAPNTLIVNTVAAIAAWKLSLYGRDALGTTKVTSEGSDKFRAKKVVTLPVIDGHRDTNDTACPGSLLYDRLPAIRKRAAKLIKDAAAPPTIAVVTAPTLTGTPTLGQVLTLTLGTYAPAGTESTYAWTRNGTVVPEATGTTYTITDADLGATIGATVTTTLTGYTTRVDSLAAAGIVTAPTRIVVRTRGRVRGAVVRVRVRTIGSAVPPTGTVTVKVRRQVKTVALVDGKAVVVFDRVLPGTRTAAVTYGGTTVFSTSSASARVAVARRKPRG